jgi:hypothetical protein
MSTRVLMTASAALMVVVALPATFAPAELLVATRSTNTPLGVVVVQVAGALAAGFAMLNWMARGNLLGGIYSRPIVIGNFTHFLIAGLALVKAAPSVPVTTVVLGLGVSYLLFAAAFGFVLFRQPAAAR